MTMAERVDQEPESLESIASRMESHALALAPELESMSLDERERYYEEREAEEARRRHLAKCAEIADELVPPIFRRAIPLPQAAEQWLEDFWTPTDEWGPNGLALIGRPGCGKTQAAWTITDRVLRRGWDDVRFEEASDLFDELTRRSHNKSSDKDLLASLGGVGLLVLDDLGAKPLTEFREERLERILNARWKNRKPTVISTNIAAVNFGKQFGDRNASRISGMCRVVVFPNHDHRSGINYDKGRS